MGNSFNVSTPDKVSEGINFIVSNVVIDWEESVIMNLFVKSGVWLFS